MSGRQSASHMPESWSEAVPPTTKSDAIMGHPMRSAEATKGVPSSFSPATMGSMKYGPKLHGASLTMQIAVA